MGVTELIHKEHQEFREKLNKWDELLAEFGSGVGTFLILRLKDEFIWVQKEVLPHIMAEENFLFPFLLNRNKELSDTLERLRKEHSKLKDLISQLEELVWKRQLGIIDNVQTRNLLETFRVQILHHLREEEEYFIPFIAKGITEKEDAKLERKWKEKVSAFMPQKPITDDLAYINGSIHALLDELLLQHLEALTSMDLDSAKRLFEQFSKKLIAHSEVEDKVALPFYEHLANFPKGGKPYLFESEHRGIERLTNSLRQYLESLSPDDPSVRRRIVTNLDRYMHLRHLIDHHTLREQNIFYPLLEKTLEPEEKKQVREALEKAINSG